MDEMAHYHLGNLLYDNDPTQAVAVWEAAKERSEALPRPDFKTLYALVHRNLALAYAQHEKNIPKAIASLEKAVEFDPTEPRFFYELDVQYEAGGGKTRLAVGGQLLPRPCPPEARSRGGSKAGL